MESLSPNKYSFAVPCVLYLKYEIMLANIVATDILAPRLKFFHVWLV